MIDGLYQVTWRGVCAGFVVEGGRITMCAPMLQKHPWMREYAVRTGG